MAGCDGCSDPYCGDCAASEYLDGISRTVSFVKDEKGQEDPGYRVFMQMRVEEFRTLWDKFNATGGDVSNEAFIQVINGLPIEALKDWERSHSPATENPSHEVRPVSG